MTQHPTTAHEIRTARTKQTGRIRDIAETLGLREAQLIAAEIGRSATAIEAHPNTLIPAIEPIGTCMALTRNDSCVIEKDGEYTDYHGGEHATMTLNPNIDMRMFPRHWVHAYAVEEETDTGIRRSIQVYDAAGDAVHKCFLRASASVSAFEQLKTRLALELQAETLALAPRAAPEGARIVQEKRDILLKEWRRMTDTHQFLRLCAKLKMNRLGAYRIAGAPFVRPLMPEAIPHMLAAVREAEIGIMLFVGNRGCIEIHTGPIRNLKPMGPWENVLDEGFNLHLRRDHVAEVWAVEKPTQRGMALSVEAFSSRGDLILQAFGIPKEGQDTRPAFARLVADLPDLQVHA